MPETILYRAHPAMFRNRPVLFLLCLALVGAWGIGLPWLLAWWIHSLATTLTVTDERISLRRGILAKYTSDVLIADVRNVQIGQSMLQRLFGVGSVGISSAGQGGLEIEVTGLPAPWRVKGIIDERRAESRLGRLDGSRA